MSNGHYDIGEADLQTALARSVEPLLLLKLVDLSRLLFGWFNKRQTRCDEYVWIAKACMGRSDMLIADIGAGVSPLPVFLADLGHRVLTIDNSKIHRILGRDMETWNGWGYLDYSKLRDIILSFNSSVTDLPIDIPHWDLCYSVSVIEHIPAAMRRSLLEQLRDRLTLGGELMLTVDLLPRTNNLWNLEQGREVESPQDHGDFDNIINEIQNYGFEVKETKIERGYSDEPRSDVGYIRCMRGEL